MTNLYTNVTLQINRLVFETICKSRKITIHSHASKKNHLWNFSSLSQWPIIDLDFTLRWAHTPTQTSSMHNSSKTNLKNPDKKCAYERTIFLWGVTYRFQWNTLDNVLGFNTTVENGDKLFNVQHIILVYKSCTYHVRFKTTGNMKKCRSLRVYTYIY